MKVLSYAAIAALVLLPVLAQSPQAQAATASQYSAKGHGRHPTMTNRPSRAIYHNGMRHHRRY